MAWLNLEKMGKKSKKEKMNTDQKNKRAKKAEEED
jgi:hypothetical protein